MMNTIYKAAIFYGIAGFVVGGFVASMDKVNFSIRGRNMPYPRVWVFFVTAALWPLALLKMVTGK